MVARQMTKDGWVVVVDCGIYTGWRGTWYSKTRVMWWSEGEWPVSGVTTTWWRSCAKNGTHESLELTHSWLQNNRPVATTTDLQLFVCAMMECYGNWTKNNWQQDEEIFLSFLTVLTITYCQNFVWRAGCNSLQGSGSESELEFVSDLSQWLGYF